MKRTEILKKIAIYLLQPEDTTEAGYNCTSTDCMMLRTHLPWIGLIKAVFWTMVAIVSPLTLYLFSSWFFL